MFSHAQLVERAAAWLRNSAQIPSYRPGVTQRVKCGVVLSEYASSISEIPDAIGWCYSGSLSILIECKASRSDFKADSTKFFRDDRHAHFGIGNHRYYLCNPGITKDHELPANWGLLESHGRSVKVIRLATRQESDKSRECKLLWSECRKIQIVERGGVLLKSRNAKRIMACFEQPPEITEQAS